MPRNVVDGGGHEGGATRRPQGLTKKARATYKSPWSMLTNKATRSQQSFLPYRSLLQIGDPQAPVAALPMVQGKSLAPQAPTPAPAPVSPVSPALGNPSGLQNQPANPLQPSNPAMPNPVVQEPVKQAPAPIQLPVVPSVPANPILLGGRRDRNRQQIVYQNGQPTVR